MTNAVDPGLYRIIASIDLTVRVGHTVPTVYSLARWSRCGLCVQQQICTMEEATKQQIEISTSSKLSSDVIVEAVDRPVNGDDHQGAALPPLNASQLRDRTRKKRHTIKKLEKKLELLHRQIKK